MRSELTTVPLQSRPNASPFWIMLLLSLGALEHGMINAGGTRSGRACGKSLQTGLPLDTHEIATALGCGSATGSAVPSITFAASPARALP
jgi:hypothetical protein